MQNIISKKNVIRTWGMRLLYVIGFILLLFIGLQAGIYYYFQSHKTQIGDKISELMSEKINGEIQFDSLDIVLFKGFPSATVQLKNLIVTDSLYAKHKIKAIDITEMFISLNTLSMLKGNVYVNKLILANGTVHFFTDSTQYSNTSIFKQKEEKSSAPITFDHIDFENIQVVIEDRPKQKIFDFKLNKVVVDIAHKGSIDEAAAAINVAVKELNFNQDRGGFLRGNTVRGNLLLKINFDANRIEIMNRPLLVDDEKIYVGGVFTKPNGDINFELDFEAPSANFKKIRNSLSDFLAKKLSVVDLEKNIAMKANLQGRFNYPDTPAVRVNCLVKDNTLQLRDNVFKKASFNFEFYNFMDSTKGHDDKNSYITLKKLAAEWNKIPLVATNTHIINLITPYLVTNITSETASENLSQFSDGTMTFKNGTARAAVTYKGPIKENDLRPRSINGLMRLTNTDITYLPNKSTFTNCRADVKFNNDDMYLQNVVIHKNEDVIKMEGYAKQFLNFYFNDPSKAAIEWTIDAESLHLGNYLNFFERSYTRRNSAVTTAKNINRFNTALANFAKQSSMHLSLNVNKVQYKKFVSSLVRADISLMENSILLNKAAIKFKKGTILSSAKISTNTAIKNFEFNVDLDNIDISNVLYAFDNFGQPTINDKNIAGILNLKAGLTGQLNSKVQLKPNSLSGQLAFKLSNGYLKDFEPLKKIERFTLRTRNLSDLDIRKLEGVFTIKNGLIFIPPTEVNTSALTVFMQGVYGVDKGTDIKLLIPLRNPKKDEIKEAKGIEVDKQRGLKLYLHGEDDANGKVQFSWLPRDERPNFGQ